MYVTANDAIFGFNFKIGTLLAKVFQPHVLSDIFRSVTSLELSLECQYWNTGCFTF